MIKIAISFEEVNSIQANEIWESWLSNAISKGISPETRRNVYDDWSKGRIDLLISARVWDEIR